MKTPNISAGSENCLYFLNYCLTTMESRAVQLKGKAVEFEKRFGARKVPKAAKKGVW